MMFCANCGKEIPEGSKFCGFCGKPTAQSAVAETVAENAETVKEAAVETVSEQAETVREVVAVETVAEQAETVKEAVAESPAPMAPVKPAYSPIPEEKPKKEKKGKGGLVAGIVIAAVAVVAVVVGVAVFARDRVGNMMHAAFDSPKEYYEYVEKKKITALSKNMEEGYVSNIIEKLDVAEFSAMETIKIKLGSRGKEFVNMAKTLGVDLSWLDSVGITYTGSQKDDKLSVSVVPTLNDVKLLTAKMLMDTKKGAFFIQLPELSEKYLGMELGDDYEDMMENFNEVFGTFEKMIKSYPSPEKMEELALKYYQIIMDQVEEMEKTKAKLEVDDVTQECTLLTMDLRTKDVQKILTAVLKELSKDKEVKKMMMDLFDAMDSEYIDSEEMYEDFLDGIDDALDNVEDVEIDRFVMEIYLDKSGEVIGRSVTVKVDGEEVTIKAFWPKKDDKTGLEFSLKTPDSKASFVGTAKEKNGRHSGEYVLKVQDKKILKVGVEDYDVNEAKKGNLVGKFTFRPGSDVDLKEMLEDLGVYASSPFYVVFSSLDLALDIQADVKDEAHNLAFTLLDGGKDVISLSFEGKKEKADDISIPGSYISLEKDGEMNEEELMEYVKGLDFKSVVDALRQAGLPAEWVDLLEENVEMFPAMFF